MNEIEHALSKISQELSARGVSWALIGGFAVSARAEPRFTRDVDVAVAVRDDAAAENLIRSLLQESGYSLVATVEHEPSGRLATARLISPSEQGSARVLVDLLFASSGIEPEIVAAAEALEVLPSLTLPVARPGHLVVLKLLARGPARPQDSGDLEALREAMTNPEHLLAQAATAQVMERGFNRERDLTGDLAAYMHSGVAILDQSE